MNRLRLFHSLSALFRKRRLDTELDEELSFHVDSQIEENVATGMTPEEARRVALRDLPMGLGDNN